MPCLLKLIIAPELRTLILFYTNSGAIFVMFIFTSIRAPILRHNSILFFFSFSFVTLQSLSRVIILFHFYSVLNSTAIFLPCLFEIESKFQYYKHSSLFSLYLIVESFNKESFLSYYLHFKQSPSLRVIILFYFY